MNKVVDWQVAERQKHDQIIRDNIRENLKRVEHDYNVGDMVMLKKKGILRKLSRKKSGPYKITRVHTNGTVTIQKGISSERVNIRRIEPIFE
jgi:putative ribosome biogenesis GTPase RsgA